MREPTSSPFAAKAGCTCAVIEGPTKLIVVTGGPGAGKTAVLEIASRAFCSHVGIVPEAASVLFNGGFPRLREGRRPAQRAIFHVARELESMACSVGQLTVALCDRGTVDGVAYWPDEPASYWSALGTSHQAEIARYNAVIHLRTPTIHRGYDHSNGLRTESADEAAEIDERIADAWSSHPNRIVIDCEDSFLTKATAALQAIDKWIPSCTMKAS